MSGQAISAISAYNPVTLGMGSSSQLIVKTDTNAAIVGGAEGTIYIDNDFVEAFGICARGRRSNNEDGIGVAEREDGSLLFQVADGMGGHAAGEVASAAVIEGMAKAVCGDGRTFVEARKPVVDHLVAAGIRSDTGSTFAGLLIDRNVDLPMSVGILGDSQISAFARGTALYTSVSHGEVYRVAHSTNRQHLLRYFKGHSSGEAKRLAKRAARMWSKEKSLAVLRLLYEYVGPPGRSPLTRSFNIYAVQQIDEDEVARRAGGDSLYMLYTDGVSDLYTPLDLAEAFRGRGVPLYEMGLKFAEQLVMEKFVGREIDIGLRSGMFRNKITLTLGKNKDNYAYWLIRLKK